MDLASNLIVAGLVEGGVLAAVALGFVVLYRATHVFSLAQGSFMLLGALLFYWAQTQGAGLALSIVVGSVLTGIAGGVVYLLIFSRRLLAAEAITVTIATIGLATLIQMLCLLIWGANPLSLTHNFAANPHLLFGHIRVSNADIATVVLAVGLTAAVVLVFRFTTIGLRMRAMADSPGLAVYAGVNVRRLGAVSWTMGALCAAVAGVAISLGSGQADPNAIAALGYVAFPAILLGGLDSVGGALVGGMIMGLISSVGTYYLGGSWQDVIPYFVLFGILLIRPAGLFGSRSLARL